MYFRNYFYLAEALDMLINIINCEKEKNGYAVKVKYNYPDCLEIYPDGKGGQLGDRGVINGIEILEVKEDKIIVAGEIAPGEYEYSLNMERRADIALQHTAEHLLSGILLKEYGLNNVGYRMGEDVSTCDIDTENFSDEVLNEIAEKVNKAISEGAEVCEKIVTHKEAAEINLRKKLSPKITGDIRIVEIKNYDLCACAGFHLKNIKDIKIFKFTSYERVKGKYTRVSFIAGERAIEDYNKKAEIITKLNHKFSCRDYEIIEKLENYQKEHENLKRNYLAVLQSYAHILGADLAEKAETVNSHKVVVYEGEKDLVDSLRKYFANTEITFAGIASDTVFLSSQTVNCTQLIKNIISADNTLKGGGSPKQGNIKGTVSKETILTAIKNIAEQ